MLCKIREGQGTEGEKEKRREGVGRERGGEGGRERGGGREEGREKEHHLGIKSPQCE